MNPRVPFIARAAPLYLLVYLALLSWWWVMSLLFQEGRVAEGVVVAYLLPAAVSLSAFVAASAGSQHRLLNLVHLWVLLPMALAFIALALGPLSGDLRWTVLQPSPDQPTGPFNPRPHYVTGPVTSDPSPFVGIGLISAVMTLMLYPLAGTETYHRLYRRPLFVSGVIFMPFFIALAALFRAPYSPMGGEGLLAPVQKAAALLALFAGFWLSGAWLASRRTQGEHVPGLTAPFRPKFLMGEKAVFRPDLILPGGVLLVKGVVLMGVGLMISIHDHPTFPWFHWWGFALAFFGIIALIPVRGMWKMFRGRGPRMVGERGTLWGRELLLFSGLLLLLYGFVNAFKGFVPFQVLGTTPRYMALPSPPGLMGLGLILLSFVVLVFLRGLYKTRLPEGAETLRQLFLKQLLLYIGALLLVLGVVHLLHLPVDAVKPDNPARDFIGFYPVENPIGFGAGLALHVLGALLILGFRPLALRNEFRATMRIMPGAIADMDEEKRRAVLEKRMRTLAAMPEPQRREHVRWMVRGVNGLPPEKRSALMAAQVDVMAGLSSEERTRMMQAMDAAMMEGA